MEQLSGLDAAFVQQDSARTPMHICAVLIYDSGAEQANAISLAQLRDLAKNRLEQFPLFRRKLHRVVMDMDTPYWVDMTEPDWRLHITRSTLPFPGDWDTLQHTLEDLHGSRMNLALPLWQIHLIDGLCDIPGLPPHCQALLLKIHHSAVDGISLARILNALHQQAPEHAVRQETAAEAPAQWALWTRAHVRGFNRQFKLAETMSNLVPGVMRVRKTREQFSDLPAIHSGAARFNARVKAGRHTGAALMPMPEVTAIKRAVRRVTLNDIAVACVSGALREYLLYYQQLPRHSLAAGVPISLRGSSNDSAGANRIATMIVGLATHVADPVDRLRLVHRYAVAGKKQIDALGSGTVMDISDSLPPSVLAEGIRSMAWARRLVEIPVPFHTMVSNVPGPTTALHLGAAKLIVPLGLGPVRDNMGLFHIVSSSDSMMSLSFSACSKLLPDADFYQQCLRNAFAALLGRALSEA